MAETTQAGTAVPAGGHGAKAAFPPFESGTFASQLLWLALSFALLYILMSKLALPRVETILATRRDRIASDIDAAKRLKAESDAAVAAYEASLVEARSKAQAIATQTRDAVNAETDAARHKLETELGEKLTAAEAQIASAKTAALGNVRSIAADAASAIVEQLTGKAPSAGVVLTAIDAAVAK